MRAKCSYSLHSLMVSMLVGSSKPVVRAAATSGSVEVLVLTFSNQSPTWILGNQVSSVVMSLVLPGPTDFGRLLLGPSVDSEAGLFSAAAILEIGMLSSGSFSSEFGFGFGPFDSLLFLD